MTTVVDDLSVVTLTRAAFSAEAIKRASYALMARFDVSLSIEGEDFVCRLAPARPDAVMENAERDFRREVVDQDLRILIEQRTEGYRDAILGLAFSRTGLQDG